MEHTYPGFKHTAQELSAYITSQGIFTISLKNKAIIHFTPADADAFRAWLDDNKIRDANKS